MKRRTAKTPPTAPLVTMNIQFTVDLTYDQWTLLLAHAQVFLPSVAHLHERERIAAVLAEYGLAALRDAKKHPLTRHLVADSEAWSDELKGGVAS